MVDSDPFPSVSPWFFLLSPFLLVLSALFSGFEVAFFSLRKSQVDKIAKHYPFLSRIFTHFLKHPHQVLASILIGNNFVNLLLIVSVASLLEQWENVLPEWIRFVIDVTLGTGLILIFGEILPKLIANRSKEKFLLISLFPMVLLFWLLFPISYLFTLLTKVIRPKQLEQEKISRKELLQLVERAPEDIAPEEEKRLLRSLIQMETLQVRSIMTPRTEIVTIPESMELPELLRFIQEHRFARYPVYGKDLDDIKGILFVKDLLRFRYGNENLASDSWQKYIRKPYFVPESSSLLSLLTHFQSKRVNIAIVVDEYGGTAGLVTLSDLLQNFFGISGQTIQKINETTYLIDGHMPIIEFCRALRLPEDYFEPFQGESETMAGLFLESYGDIPGVGAKVTVKHFELTVNQMNGFTIQKMLVKRLGV